MSWVVSPLKPAAHSPAPISRPQSPRIAAQHCATMAPAEADVLRAQLTAEQAGSARLREQLMTVCCRNGMMSTSDCSLR